MTDNKHLVFVHGTLMKGLLDAYILYKSEYIGVGVTEDLYSMFMVGVNSTMIIEDIKNTHIHGEVYRVADHTMNILDSFYVYSNFYKRVSIRVDVPGVGLLNSYIYLSSSSNNLLKGSREVINGNIRDPIFRD